MHRRCVSEAARIDAPSVTWRPKDLFSCKRARFQHLETIVSQSQQDFFFFYVLSPSSPSLIFYDFECNILPTRG